MISMPSHKGCICIAIATACQLNQHLCISYTRFCYKINAFTHCFSWQICKCTTPAWGILFGRHIVVTTMSCMYPTVQELLKSISGPPALPYPGTCDLLWRTTSLIHCMSCPLKRNEPRPFVSVHTYRGGIFISLYLLTIMKTKHACGHTWPSKVKINDRRLGSDDRCILSISFSRFMYPDQLVHPIP